MITQQQIDAFHHNGFLVVENVLTDAELHSLRADFEQWVEDSRQYTQPWGETMDGRARFDIDPVDHTVDHPSLRRISSPTEISENYYRVAMQSSMADIAGKLIGGSGTRFHHSKINSKLPHTATSVKWHQDFPFTPHTNDDMITALLMMGDVTEENGPLQVVPESHQGPLYSHWQNGDFTGMVETSIVDTQCQQHLSCFGPAGSVCFMHTRLLHASGANHTDLARNLFITVYAAEDALELAENPLNSVHAGELVYGVESGNIRITPNELRPPKKPKGASFFVQQAGLEMM